MRRPIDHVERTGKQGNISEYAVNLKVCRHRIDLTAGDSKLRGSICPGLPSIESKQVKWDELNDKEN